MADAIVVFMFLAVALLAAAASVQRAYDLDSITEVPSELLGRFVSLPGSGPASFRRRYVRAIAAERIVMPSGEIRAVEMLLVTLAERDLKRLCPTGEYDDLARDTARVYRRAADRRGWVRPARPSTRVFLEVDPTRQPGWTPRARLTTSIIAGAIGDSERVSDNSLDTVPATVADSGSLTTEYHPSSGALSLVLVALDGSLTLEFSRPRSTLGKGAEVDMEIPFPGVSRRHAVIGRDGESWFVSDLGSTNGTFVDGEALRVGENRPLTDGSLVRLGPIGPDLRVDRKS